MRCRPAPAAIVVAAALVLSGCAAPKRPAAPQPITALRYEARVAAASPAVVDVVLSIAGSAAGLAAEAPPGVLFVEVNDGRGVRRVERRGSSWPIACAASCTVRYRIDLGATAEAEGDSFEIAMRSGDAVLAPAWVWLLRPEPLATGIPVDLHVTTEPPVKLASALRRIPGTHDRYALQSQELVSAGYTAIGAFDELPVRVLGGTVDVTVLGELPHVDRATLARWVADSAASLNDVFRRFPVPRARLFLAVEPGHGEVRFGRTLPAGGASIALGVGRAVTAGDLYADWILVHELFHLGVPSFPADGRWIDEGLATYYEPVLRARAGFVSRRALWAELAEGLERGLPAPGDPGLLTTRDGTRIYWGGAAFVLQADVLIRLRTGGARSLDDGLRAVLARGGDATQLWTLRDYLRAIDEAVGVPVTAELCACLSEQGRAAGVGSPKAASRTPGACPPSDGTHLFALLADLGVSTGPDGSVALRADAPLASLRERIETGSRRQPGGIASVPRPGGAKLLGPPRPAAGSAGEADPRVPRAAPLDAGRAWPWRARKAPRP